jgi:hypothetical protein
VLPRSLLRSLLRGGGDVARAGSRTAFPSGALPGCQSSPVATRHALSEVED